MSADTRSHTVGGSKPNCYECMHRRELPGDCHSTCANREAKVTGDAHGIRRGWFFWPYNFDPTWLRSCDGFAAIKTHKSDEDVSNTGRIPASRKSGCSTQELCSDAEVAVRSGRPLSGTVEHGGAELAVGSVPDDEVTRG